jgi:hypothetical protein
MVKGMITDAPQSKLLNIKVFAVKEAREISWDEVNQTRRCSARIYSNAGTEVVAFKIYWVDRKKGEFFYETE